MHRFLPALLLPLLLGACASAPPVRVHFTAGIVFHTCGLVTAVELVTNDGRLFYFTQAHANPDDFADAIEAENKLGEAAVDVEVNPHCMKA